MTDVMAWRLGAGWSDDPSPVIRLEDDDWDDDEDWDEEDDWEDDEDWDDEDWEDEEDWDEDDVSAAPSDDDWA